MEVKIDSVAISPTSLSFGGVIHGPEKAWMRFVIIEVDDSAFSHDELRAIVVWAGRLLNRYLDSEPGEAEPPDVPLF